MSFFDLIHVVAGLALFGFCIQMHERCRGLPRLFFTLAVLMLAFMFGLHLWPGFPHWQVIKAAQLGPCSLPMNWTVHLDKAAAGMTLLLCCRGLWAGGQWQLAGRQVLRIGAGLVLILGLGWLLDFVRWQAAAPSWWAAWLLSNILLVVIAEEALFRGFLQRELERVCAGRPYGAQTALVLSALLFGLAHAGGGWTYALLATTAGLVYGCLWQTSRSLLWPILAHSLLNAVHFLAFSYPAWNGASC